MNPNNPPTTKILICMGTSGIAAGAQEVYNAFARGLKQNKLTKKFKIIRTGDRGLFRDVLVDVIDPQSGRVTYEYVKLQDVPKIIEEHLKQGKTVKELQAGEDYERFFSGQMRIVLSNCGEIDPEDIGDYIAAGGYTALKKVLSQPQEKTIEEIKKSGLRGRGGAGFPTGLKWELCSNAKEKTKYIICNADEGDPGAFMDRSILEGDPQSVIEGMIIAGRAVGASEGFIYCRAEYPLAIKRLKTAISQAKKKKFLGKTFDISIKQGAGAFVCGEETALIASIEGKRGMPKPRPPFPVEKGLFGKPTVINNVETLANIPHIILKGAEWFSSIGTESSKGTKVFALAGKVKNTGLIEVPMGTTIRQIVYGPGGGELQKKIKIKGVQIGGPSGGCIPAAMLNTPVDYESITQTGAIMGSGGMVVMDEKTCMVDMANFFLNFTVAESCGKCVPCRVGLKRMSGVLDKITGGNGGVEHIEFLRNIGATIQDTSLCGLGKTAVNSVLTTLKYFPDEYMAHIRDKKCPACACVELLKFRITEEKCTMCGKCFTVCPAGAVEWKKKETAKIILTKCIKCKECINVCDFKAIE